MSRRQRRAHLILWLILGPAVIIGVAIALADRAPSGAAAHAARP